MRWNQWVTILVILCALSVIVTLANFTELQSYYIVNYWGPRLQKELGFRAGYSQGRFSITEVTPGGVFSTAGVHVGYIPVGYMHGFESGFYDHLQSSRGQTTTLQFIDSSDESLSIRHKIELYVPH